MLKDLVLRKEYQRQYRLKNIERLKRQAALWRAKNREYKRRADKAHYLKNIDKIRKYRSEWAKEKRKNPEWAAKQTLTMAVWRKNNPRRNKKISRAHYRRNHKNNVTFTLGVTVRNRMRDALQRNKNHKCSRLQELLGCKISELRHHLEKQFRPGMSWENYGPVWHIDHKKPCASFDLSIPEHQRECFHFSNLQPLFAKENLSKGAKI
jgi:hypothetical protein